MELGKSTLIPIVCLDRYKQFWCEGQASKIKQNSTNYFADLYAKGDLDPKVKATV